MLETTIFTFKNAEGSLRTLSLFELPASARTIEEGPYELTTIGRMTSAGIRWSHFHKGQEKTASPYIEVGNIPEYKERKGAWRELESKIITTIKENT